MRIRAEMGRQRAPLLPQEYQVDKVVELPNVLFSAFMDRPLDRCGSIIKNIIGAQRHDGSGHCLLVLGEDYMDGVLVQCGEDGYAARSAYVAGARDIVQARLDRAADFIISQGTGRTVSGSWYVYREELEDRFGITIREGNGLDTMMKETLERRPEVAQAEAGPEHIKTTFCPEFCTELRSSTAETRPDVRLKDILPLLTGGGLTFLCHKEEDSPVLAENLRELTAAGRENHAALLNARVSGIAPTPEGTEVVLTGVAPGELARFNEVYEAFEEAEQAMGPTI